MVNNCPDSETPVVTAAAAVPMHNTGVVVYVTPVAAFTVGMWVVVGTTPQAPPFVARVVEKTDRTLTLFNAMEDGKPIYANPGQGTVLSMCASVNVTSRPSNINADPSLRCFEEMPPLAPGEVVGLQGLTRGDTITASGKCQRYLHNVAATQDTFVLYTMPSIAAGAATRMVVQDGDTHQLRWVNKTGSKRALITMTEGGGLSLNEEFPADLISTASSPEVAGGFDLVIRLPGGALRTLPRPAAGKLLAATATGYEGVSGFKLEAGVTHGSVFVASPLNAAPVASITLPKAAVVEILGVGDTTTGNVPFSLTVNGTVIDSAHANPGIYVEHCFSTTMMAVIELAAGTHSISMNPPGTGFQNSSYLTVRWTVKDSSV